MIAPRGGWNLEVRADPGFGRMSWLEELHTSHGAGLRSMLRRMLGSEDEAQDVYQDCMHHLARCPRPGQLRSVPAYAYRTAANLATETIRRRGRRAAHWARIVTHYDTRDCGRAAPATATDNDRQRAVHRLRSAVRGLPQHLRDVIVLRDLSGMPYRQVARVLGIQAATARVYRRQAILRLESLLDPVGPGSE
jgi:RNA polymerase sigma-70 factor (ECF subfamily)